MAKKTEQPQAMMRVNLDDLILWSENYNMGDVGAIAMSIRRFGLQNVPRVWNGLNLRAGNHTTLALRLIRKEGQQPGDKSWPPQHVYLDEAGNWFVDVMSLGDLSEAEATAFAIADNRDAALASQDETALLKHLLNLSKEADDLLLATGYSEDDMEQLRRVLEQPIVGEDFNKTPVEALDYYLNGAVKQIVLYMDATTYLQTVERLTAIMEHEGLDSNTTTILHILDHYEQHKAQQEGNKYDANPES